MATANMQAQENDKGGHRGLDFTISPGYQIYTGDGGGGAVSAEIGLGKRFSKNFYWGISSGALIPTGDGDVQIPIATDFKVLFPLKTKTITPGFMVRGGYVVNTSDGYDIKVGKHTQHVDASNFTMIQAMPTVDMAIGGSVDFSLGVGYTHYIPTKGGGSGTGAVTIRTAFTFHKSTNERTKPKAYTRERGIELTLEGGLGIIKNNDEEVEVLGGNIIASYKLNPKLNVGVGFGYEHLGKLSIYSGYIYDDGETRDFDAIETGRSNTKRIFARGEYSLTSRMFTPFISCDLGINMYDYGDISYYNSQFEELSEKIKKTGLYVSPAIGASLRVAPNSYLKLRVGYQLTPGNCEHKSEAYDNKVKYIAIKCPKFSQPYLNIGFTHTFSWGEKWFK